MNRPAETGDQAAVMGNHALLAIRDLYFHWPGRHRFSVRVDDFTLPFEQKLFLKGPSGSGKSTLLSLICGIVRPTSGSICINGVDITQLRASQVDRFRVDNFGIIFQQFNLLPYGSLLDNVLLPLQFSRERKNRASRDGSATAEAARLLNRLGVDDVLHSQLVTSLSIGQQQRAAVARAIIGNPRLVIADEPTSALDSDNRNEFMKLLFEEVSRAQAGLIMVSHDDSLASGFDRKLNITEIISTERTGTA